MTRCFKRVLSGHQCRTSTPTSTWHKPQPVHSISTSQYTAPVPWLNVFFLICRAATRAQHRGQPVHSISTNQYTASASTSTQHQYHDWMFWEFPKRQPVHSIGTNQYSASVPWWDVFEMSLAARITQHQQQSVHSSSTMTGCFWNVLGVHEYTASAPTIPQHQCLHGMFLKRPGRSGVHSINSNQPTASVPWRVLKCPGWPWVHSIDTKY